MPSQTLRKGVTSCPTANYRRRISSAYVCGLQAATRSCPKVERSGYLRPEHLGVAGNEQGRDVIAYRASDGGEQLWYFQCKRYQTLCPATLIAEVEKYNKLVTTDPTKKPFGVVFVTNAVLSAKARDEVREFCGQHGYESEFWAKTELDLHVKKHQDIVTEFFNVTLAPPLPESHISISRLPSAGPTSLAETPNCNCSTKPGRFPTSTSSASSPGEA